MRNLCAVSLGADGAVQFIMMSVQLPYYLLDCLYAERKDRSILFWKALPVSDAQTVLSKLLVALAVVPLGVFVLTLFTDVAASGILAVHFHGSPLVRAFLRWDTQAWLHTQGLILGALIVVMLWYAPLAAYLMLVSAWAKRNAFLWAAMPPLVAMLVEKIAFGTSYVAISRLSPERYLAPRLNHAGQAFRQYGHHERAPGHARAAARGARKRRICGWDCWRGGGTRVVDDPHSQAPERQLTPSSIDPGYRLHAL